MAIIAEKLFCPDCGNEDLWVDDSISAITSCRDCGGYWERVVLHRICAELIARKRTYRMSRDYAGSFRILFRYMYNPITGKNLGVL